MNYNELPTRIKVDPEHYIPVAKHELVDALVHRIDDPDVRTQFQNCCRIIDAIFHFEYHKLANELQEDFSHFDSVKSDYRQRFVQEPERLIAEERFLVNFRRLMAKGNFEPLSERDIEIAHAEDYLFNLPVTVAWEGLDDRMLSRFFETHGYHDGGDAPSASESTSVKKDEDVPNFAHRILIYRRGVGIDRTTGRFILEKIDILVSRFLVSIWTAVRFCLSAVGFYKTKQPSQTTHAASGSTPRDGRAEDSLKLSSRHLAQHIHAERYIERMTLRRSNPSLLSLARSTTIQEPTFKELVILFRFATPPDASPEQQNNAIHIKMFPRHSDGRFGSGVS